MRDAPAASRESSSRMAIATGLPSFVVVKPINQVVKVDCYVPGCPPTPKAIYYALSELLQGRIPILPSEIMRFD